MTGAQLDLTQALLAAAFLIIVLAQGRAHFHGHRALSHHLWCMAAWTAGVDVLFGLHNSVVMTAIPAGALLVALLGVRLNVPITQDPMSARHDPVSRRYR